MNEFRIKLFLDLAAIGILIIYIFLVNRYDRGSKP